MTIIEIKIKHSDITLVVVSAIKRAIASLNISKITIKEVDKKGKTVRTY